MKYVIVGIILAAGFILFVKKGIIDYYKSAIN